MATRLMSKRRSVATIDGPEFINVTSLNPLISKCEVKVLYIGENRNKSAISKEVAAQMAETLPGCPIVGYYREDKEDFFDHGDIITIDGDGVKFNDATKPYGFVAPDAKIWFQKFIDTDEMGIETEREYLMTEAFLWTGQYPECKRVLEQGNPQSMKLDNNSLNGTWAKSDKSGVDFFIINDAVIENLCILGEDIEPCFEEASISKPDVSATFSKNGVNTLFSMMKELKDLLSQEGGQTIMNEELNVQTSVVEEPVAAPEEKFSVEQDNSVETVIEDTQVNTEEFKKQDEEEKKDETPSNDSESKDSDTAKEDASEKEDEDKKKEDYACGNKDEDKKKYELLQTEYSELESRYAELEASYNELVAFKNSIEEKQKDELIDSFYMLDESDKADVIANKSSYSLSDIEKELSVICVRKKVNFNLDEEESNEAQEEVTTTFNVDNVESNSLPAWLKAVREISELH